MKKPGTVGIHISPWHVTVVVCDADSNMINSFEVMPFGDEVKWTFSNDQILHLLDQVQAKVEMTDKTVCLSMASDFVMFRQVPMSVSKDQQIDDQTVRFASESILPMPLEDMQIAVMTPHPTPPVVLAASHKPWDTLLEMMDDRGWVCPYVSLDAELLWYWAGSTLTDIQPGGGYLCAVVDQHGGCVAAGTRTHLYHCRTLQWESGREVYLQHELKRTWQATGELGSQLVGVIITEPDLSLDVDTSDGGFVCFSPEQVLPNNTSLLTVGACHAWMAAHVLSQPEINFQNLRQGSWRSKVVDRGNKRSLRFHLMAAVIAALLMMAALLYHGMLLRNQGQDFERKTRQVWAEVFPDVLPPVDVEGRLVSEYTRERALRGQDGKVPQYKPALVTLKDMIGSFPEKIPLQIHQIDLSSETCVLTGEARSHGEVEAVTAQLSDRGFQTQPASTERTSAGTVRFTIRFRLDGGLHG